MVLDELDGIVPPDLAGPGIVYLDKWFEKCNLLDISGQKLHQTKDDS
jgi:hypothetical protein